MDDVRHLQLDTLLLDHLVQATGREISTLDRHLRQVHRLNADDVRRGCHQPALLDRIRQRHRVDAIVVHVLQGQLVGSIRRGGYAYDLSSVFSEVIQHLDHRFRHRQVRFVHHHERDIAKSLVPGRHVSLLHRQRLLGADDVLGDVHRLVRPVAGLLDRGDLAGDFFDLVSRLMDQLSHWAHNQRATLLSLRHLGEAHRLAGAGRQHHQGRLN